MLVLCPNCGHKLPSPLIDGICNCPTCSYDPQNSVHDRILEGSWTAIKRNLHSAEQIEGVCRMSHPEAVIVHAFAVENCYSIEEIKDALKSLGIRK